MATWKGITSDRWAMRQRRHFQIKDHIWKLADKNIVTRGKRHFEEKFDTDACDDPPEGDPTDMTPLLGLHARLAQIPSDDFYPAINQIIDFDAYLTTWAATAIMGYWDGYPNDPNNFRIYHVISLNAHIY